jgi:hypothetical protein
MHNAMQNYYWNLKVFFYAGTADEASGARFRMTVSIRLYMRAWHAQLQLYFSPVHRTPQGCRYK